MDSFYVTLPSNVINQHLENKIGSYVTYLPTTLKLDADWRVGLASIHYSNSWYNLNYHNEVIVAAYQTENSFICNKKFIEPGRYTNIKELTDEITSLYKGSPKLKPGHEPVLSYDEMSRRVKLKHGWSKHNQPVTFRFMDELGALLGAENGFQWYEKRRLYEMVSGGRWITDSLGDPHPNTLEQEVFEGKSKYDLSGGIRSLYVYSDVVDFSVVGNVMAQLLRTVEIPSSSKFGDSVVITYDRPQYLPLATKEISTIEIDIKDDSGVPIDFKFGRTEITLHFVKHG